MGLIRDSFVIFKNWADAINALPEEYQLETYKALVEYGTSGEIPAGLSSVANAMLVSFSIGMGNNIARYRASVENGKKGGNPNFKKGQPNPYYNKKKDNLEITQDNQTLPTDNLYVNDNVNVNKFVINNKYNNNLERAYACESVKERNTEERAPYLKYFNEFFDIPRPLEFVKPGYEIIDTMINYTNIARDSGCVRFKNVDYTCSNLLEAFANITQHQFHLIASQLKYNKDIKNKPYYTMGCLVSASQEEDMIGEKRSEEEKDMFIKQLMGRECDYEV